MPITSRGLNDFVVLEKDHYGDNLDRDRVRVYCFIDPSIGGCDPTTTPPKPILRLNLVGQPRREDSTVDPAFNNPDRQFTPDQLNNFLYNVPFLEYQLLLSNSAFSDNKSELIGWVNIGNFRKELRLTKKRATSLGTFALESF